MNPTNNHSDAALYPYTQAGAIATAREIAELNGIDMAELRARFEPYVPDPDRTAVQQFNKDCQLPNDLRHIAAIIHGCQQAINRIIESRKIWHDEPIVPQAIEYANLASKIVGEAKKIGYDLAAELEQKARQRFEEANRS